MKKSIGRTLAHVDVAANTSVRIHEDFFNTHRASHYQSQPATILRIGVRDERVNGARYNARALPGFRVFVAESCACTLYPSAATVAGRCNTL
jgi:hypothetical protein